MDLKYLNKLLEDNTLISEKIRQYIEEKTIRRQSIDKEEIKGHLLKADHNLKFVKDNLDLEYFDWCIILKGYYSKNHDATLCILIKEYYKKGINAEEIELLNKFLDYSEITFYVQAKEKRENASYSTKIKFDKIIVNELRIKAALFVDKAKQIIENMN
jgi:uncharacterized protein (UPF0332 family)